MKGLLIALTVARGLDIASSCAVLARPRGYETSPFLPSTCTGQVMAQGGLTIAQVWALHALHERHPKWAAVLGSVSISIEVGATVHNMRLLK